MIITIDNRETARVCSAVQYYMKNHKIIINQIPIGDFIFSNNKSNVVFEYKTIRDFMQSVNEGRLFDQALRQQKNFDYHFVIIEGTYEQKTKLCKKRNCNSISDDVYFQSIAKLNTFTTVLTSPTKQLSFPIMEKQAVSCLEQHPSLKNHFKKTNNPAYDYLMLIPGVNTTKAHTICKQLHLTTIEDLTSISTKNLLKVSGIGPVSAQKIITSIKRV